jgi:hypothetical protein
MNKRSIIIMTMLTIGGSSGADLFYLTVLLPVTDGTKPLKLSLSSIKIGTYF